MARRLLEGLALMELPQLPGKPVEGVVVLVMLGEQGTQVGMDQPRLLLFFPSLLDLCSLLYGAVVEVVEVVEVQHQGVLVVMVASAQAEVAAAIKVFYAEQVVMVVLAVVAVAVAL